MIQTRALLVDLSISQWTARKLDRKATSEIETAHSAHDAGRFNKLLISKSLLDPVAKLAGQIRDYHYSVTMPWADSGARLLPSTLFMDYADKMRAFKSSFHKAVSDLLAAYPAEIDAARVRLGTLYKPEDYPAVTHLHERFDINLSFLPIPTADDFRVTIDAETQRELRDSITAAVAERQAAAVASTYGRVRDVVGKIAERMAVDPCIFKDSLIDNARELAQLLRALNITDDPLLNEIAGDIERTLLLPPSDLRASRTLRIHIREEANKILTKLP